MKPSEDLKEKAKMIALAKTAMIFMELVEDAERQSIEVQKFVEPYVQKVKVQTEAIEAIFGSLD